MTLITRPFLSDEFVKQVPTDILTMSGITNFVGTLKSKGVIIDASTGGTSAGHVLTYNGSQILLLPQSGGTARGNALVDNIDQTAHGFGLMDVIGHTSSGYVKVFALTGQPEAIGVVSKIHNPNRFEITYQGFVTGLTGATATGSQSTFTGNTTYFLSSTVPGALTDISPTTIGHISKPMLVTLTNNTGLIFNWRGSIIASGNTTTSGLTQSSGVLGIPTDGTFSDGLLVFTASTKTVDAVDEINEVLKLLSPSAAPDLTNITKTSAGTYATGKLSFGVSRNDISYTNVSSAAGNAALDINGTYAPTSTRLGIMNSTSISGVLNDSVVAGTSYPADSFGEADKGTLSLSLNGIVIDTLNLTVTGATTSTNTRMTVTAVSAVTTSAGQAFNFKKYRKGTYNIPNTLFVNGFNYLRITHNRGSSSVTTNYLEFVYDPESSSLSFNGTPELRPPTLTGSRYISGVRYHTGGTVQFSAVTSNVYKNVYSASATAFSYPGLNNISDATSIQKTGAGLTTETNSGKNLPALNAAVSNPQATTLTLLSTHTINSQRVLGSINNTTHSLRCSIQLTHPLKSTLTSSQSILTGFLIDSAIQSSITNNQTFDGETDRIQNRDYSSLTYTNINNGVYAWDSTQNLLTGDANHNTGLLVFGGELMYPNTSYLTSTYNITAGNFSTLTYGYGFNPNYSTATGTKVHNTKFKSTNTTTQSTLTIDILHSAGNTSFLTNGGTGGTISGNNIKLECIIKRNGGSTHGYFNPFASTGNPEGIANTAITSIAGGTRVSCTLSTIPRVGNGDIVIVRVRANGWEGVISNIQITNI